MSSKSIGALVMYVPILLFSTGYSFAIDEYNVSNGVTTAGVPLGIHGVDAVALATDAVVIPGDAAFTSTHDGVAYYFASAESLTAFEAAPERYLPEFGGFCAYAVSFGRKFDGDPRFADIRDGRLYLFVNAGIFAEYQRDPSGVLAQADAVWPSIQHTAVADL